MAKHFFPQANKAYVQTNRSNVAGNLWSTQNIDLQSNLGTVRLGTKLKVNINSSTLFLNAFGCPWAFREFDGVMFAGAGGTIFKNTGFNITSTFANDNSGGVFTAYNPDTADMELFNGQLFATAETDIYSKAPGTLGNGVWSDRGDLNTGSVHKLTYFRKWNRLYVTDLGTEIKSMDTSYSLTTSGSFFIQLGGGQGIISTIAAASDRIWIGIVQSASDQFSDGSARGSVLEWDGVSSGIIAEHLLDNAAGCLAIEIFDDIPYIMDSNGVFSKYTGSGFDEIGRLPLNRQLLVNAQTGLNNRFIHPNGIISTKNETFLFLINNLVDDVSGSIVENMPSGIWEWSKENGMVHRSPLTYMPLLSSTITDFGQNRISRSGALENANLYDASPGNTGRGTIICGCTYFTDASTTSSAILIDSPTPTTSSGAPQGQKRGYFVTTWMESDEVADKWSRYWASYRRFQTATDNFVPKYRNYEEDPVEATITWVNTTSFTTATDVTAYDPSAPGFNGATGGEVEIVQGTGGMACPHITGITGPSGGLYTVTLDEAITGVTTGTAKARFQKWIKLNPSVPFDQLRAWSQFGMETESTPRIQIKACFSWTGDGEFYKSITASNEDIKVTL